jgi:hypothetical protein
MKTCKETIEDVDAISGGGYSYRNCGKPVKYKATFNDPITGKEKTIEVCGVHFNAAKKNAERIENKTGFNVNFSFSSL